MKKILSLMLAILICLSACQKEPLPEDSKQEEVQQEQEQEQEKEQENPPVSQDEPKQEADPDYKLIEDTSVYELKDSGFIVTPSSKDVFNEDYTFEWNGQKITIKKPVYTGIPTDKVYTYKAYYEFNENGYASMSTSFGYFTVDRDGKVYDYKGYEYARNNINLYSGFKDGQKSATTKVIQTGEPGNFKQRLHSLDKTPLSDYFDHISYFYNGLALVQLDGKIGFIDETGAVVVEPMIPYDHIVYPLDEPKQDKKGFWIPFFTGDAFIVPIGGEMAVIRLEREAI